MHLWLKKSDLLKQKQDKLKDLHMSNLENAEWLRIVLKNFIDQSSMAVLSLLNDLNHLRKKNKLVSLLTSVISPSSLKKKRN